MLDPKVLEELETQLSIPTERIGNPNRKSYTDRKRRSIRKSRRKQEKNSRRRNRKQR